MGGVYEAEEAASGRHVALKLIAPELAGSADTVERFRQEGRIASMVVHPRCVFVHAVDEDAGRPYIVMELMPGETLKDLVNRRGPLPPPQAIAKILDVIEGLQAAHRLEVIHRDVKPSNCFVESDGRVKVGDFGLAKSLVKDAHLTKTGAFVGTPFFASPEQVRGEGLDRQTDVYSVAATLYFLLTGQPPFWGSDSAATLARIVSDPPPSLRSLRPELSPALDRVVLRGLERDRKKRWQDLEEFRQALLTLTPDRLTPADMGRRVAAFVLDIALIWLAAEALLLILLSFIPLAPAPRDEAELVALARSLRLALFLAYFTVLEHAWGSTLGKGLCRLCVCTPQSIDPPGWGQAALRTVLCYALLFLGAAASAAILWALASDGRSVQDWHEAADVVELYLPRGWFLVGLLVMASTMRARQSFRGLDEILSGTRVAPVAQPRYTVDTRGGGWLLSLLQSRRLDRGAGPAGQLPQRIAGFAVRGALKWTPADKVVLGEDASFGRRVFLWLRPQTEPPVSRARRDAGRRTRLRWLAAGTQGDLQWDALLAPSGCPLPDYVRSEGSLAWPQARMLLEDLASEMSVACEDGSLPRALSPALVWVEADGRARLADMALSGGEGEPEVATDSQRALAFLRAVAILALEGRPRPPGDTSAAIQASLPWAARCVIEQLLTRRYESHEEVRADLATIPRE
jgi:uncharacterized RDD family membrane protein YckC